LIRKAPLPAVFLVPGTVGGYSEYLGVPCYASSLLLKDIQRGQWGVQGYVVSDCGAIGDIVVGHKYSKDAAEASFAAVKAGFVVEPGRHEIQIGASSLDIRAMAVLEVR